MDGWNGGKLILAENIWLREYLSKWMFVWSNFTPCITFPLYYFMQLMDANGTAFYLLLNPAINFSHKDIPVTIYERGKNHWMYCNLPAKKNVLISLDPWFHPESVMILEGVYMCCIDCQGLILRMYHICMTFMNLSSCVNYQV